MKPPPRTRARSHRPEVRSTGDWGRRPRSMDADPCMRQIAHGYWARWPDANLALELEHWEKAALLQPDLGPDARVSHLSAGVLWGFPLSPGMAWVHDLLGEPIRSPRQDLRPHLSLRSGRPSQTALGHVMHRGLGLEDVTGLWGAQVTSAVETLLALQPLLPGWRGVAAVDFVLAYGDAMDLRRPMTVAELETHLDDLPAGTRGTPAMRRSLKHAADRTWSPMETVLRLLVVHFGFPPPVMNYGVMLPDGSKAYIDLAWPTYKVGLEYNGRGHYLNAGYSEEMHRFNQLGEDGWQMRNVLLNDLKLPTRVHSLYQWLEQFLPRV